MEVDEAVVDLSISSSGRPTAPTSAGFNSGYPAISPPYQHLAAARRILRPRIEPHSYVDSHNSPFLLNGSGGGLAGPVRTNGNAEYSSSDESDLVGDMPPLSTVKEFTPTELKHRERGFRRLREELRAEEMKLVLLKKLKQSQQLKENVATLPPGVPASALPPAGLPSGLSITPTVVKTAAKQQPPPAAHSRHGGSAVPHHKSGGLPLPGNVQQPTGGASLMRAQPPPVRSNHHAPSPLSASPLNSRTSLSVPQPPQRSSMGRPPSGFPPGVKDLSPSVTITPAPPQSVKERPREDNQTPAQRQAAAKLALRKQLEKTLLQIPPPKPPPPEMHFIPNPSNTEFIYLVGLEHVVDFLTKESKMPIPPQPFSCSQCQSDFTPVWKWESAKKNKGLKSVICEQCVTNNVKKALKAEHTNRLKTAFVKALQQEQEIEQRLAQNGVFTSSSPAPSPVTPESLPKSVTPTPRHAPVTPPAPTPPLAQLTPPPPLPPSVSRGGGGHSSGSHSTGGHSSSGHSTGGHTSSSGGSSAAAQAAAAAAAQDKYAQQQQQQHSAAAMQAIHQQLLRTLTAGAPPAAAAHMLQFSPLFYPYQLAMAQAAAAQAAAAGGGGGGGKGATPTGPNLAELQRAADQRQYLLDMIPPGPQQRHNWKT